MQVAAPAWDRRGVMVTRLTSDQKIAGSSPVVCAFIFCFLFPHMVPRLPRSGSERIPDVLRVIEEKAQGLAKAAEVTREEVLEILRLPTKQELPKIPSSPKLLQDAVPSTTDAVIGEIKKEMRETEARYARKIEQLRQEIRRQRDELLDLKGQIRVFCRFSECELPDSVRIVSDTVRVSQPPLFFRFDRVFLPGENQDQVFQGVRDLVLGVLQGYSISILAYGPTGSGKTYTVIGTPDKPGMLPRSIRALETELEQIQDAFETKIRILEIYNDSILNETQTPYKKGNIRYALEAYAAASSSRQTGSTRCNERSSRSHLLFSLSFRMETNPDQESVLMLVDLAGSERLAQSGAEGERLKETVGINKSLSALADVVAAVSGKSKHVPYRNSRLTQELRGALGGGAKTAFIINLCPKKERIGETVTTLRFAERVGQCCLGRVVKGTDGGRNAN